jgi:hypothetical protein
MKKFYTSAIAIALSAGLYAQNPIELKYGAMITAEDAKKHLSIIASDAFEGRETAKPGAMMAANYIAEQLKKLGYQAPVNGTYFQDVPLIETTSLGKSLTVNGTGYAFRKDFTIGSYSIGTTGDFNFSAKEIIFLSHKVGGDAATELGTTDIKGKAVLLVNDGESRAGITKRLAFIQSKGPSIIITTTATQANGAGAAGGQRGGGGGAPRPSLSIRPDKQVTLAPVFNITTDVANQLFVNSGETFETFKASGDANGMQANQTFKADFAATVATTYNAAGRAVEVLGYMPGTDLKNETLVFSAHYDHLGLTTSGDDKVFNGADDDGSGTTGILEIAQAFAAAKKAGHGPRRSILFLWNVGEEKGLLGSEYYTSHPVFPLENTVTDLNIDMIGRVGTPYIGKPDSANYVYPIGSSMLSSDLHKIGEEANNTYTN